MLDLGCGPADVVACLPEGVDYVGIDVSGEYIAAARKRFGGARARFVRTVLRDFVADDAVAFGLVLGYGVLHHVDDMEATGAFDVARQALRPGGRMVTIVRASSTASRGWPVGSCRKILASSYAPRPPTKNSRGAASARSMAK